ncbi:helix-turn-helix domain-containing protein [Massilia antarctica]|uniref:helix-turn-helix domain-containing protein n=1 Tax=Massilia antarctica TaxID=2765360 RepID=UPI0007C6C047|nr:helix-turn-helix transcriptional regulator [Massilia sp. H27-R4]MCY0911119.1 helix-turn-helix transcriptional regulator [Massilia sp. H27-R4]
MNSIAHIRARLGVTQAVMAKGINVSQGNVSNYERGQSMPPDVAARLIRYAASVGCTISHNDVYAAPAGAHGDARRA